MKIYLEFKTHFDAAHWLEQYEGKCSNLHGHRWHVVILLSGTKVTNGLLLDFNTLKKIMSRVVPDHQCINRDVPEFKAETGGMNPTAENLAAWLFTKVQAELPSHVALEEVKLYESDNAAAIYKGGV